MAEDRPNKSLQRLLAERRQLERELKDQHTQQVSILFTDIVGSTTYFERRGDIDGMSMVHRHNEILFPVVKEHNGTIVKTIGDAIMAVFREPTDAVRCGAAMQKKLIEANKTTDEEPIHIRIGAHVGRVIVQEEDADTGTPFDVFGDAVNTAARIEGKANGDEVLVSKTLFEMLPEGDGFTSMPGGSLPLKGKAEPLPCVAIVWGPEAPRRTEEGMAKPSVAAPGAPPPELFVLELTLGPSGLKVAALDGARDKGTVKTYAEVPIQLADLDQLAARVDTFLHGGADSYLERIRELGRELFKSALSPRAQDRLNQTQLGYLQMQMDDELAHVPWELLHDGRDFLGVRFAIGRMIAARAEREGSYAGGDVAADGHALIISNPSGDLKHAAEEGKAVAGLIRDGFRGEVKHIDGPCTKAAFLQALQAARLVHFAGHAVSPRAGNRGGFQLSDGLASPDEVAAAVSGNPPALVFANTCYASTDQGWAEAARGTTDLASALLLKGVRHYLGPMGDIPDPDALAFALRFYENVLAGAPFAEGVREARAALRRKASEPISFARYVLYGDPRTRLAASAAGLSRDKTRSTPSDIPGMPEEAQPPPAQIEFEEDTRTRPGSPVTTLHSPVDPDRFPLPAEMPEKPRGGMGKFFIAAAAGVLFVGALLGWRFFGPGFGGAPTPTPFTEAGTPTPLSVAAMQRTGPIRISVLPFKNIGGDPTLASLSGGLSETITTDFGQFSDIQLVERFQLENKELDRAGLVNLDVLGEIEFGQSKFVDRKTSATLGKIKGTEVLLIGGYQKSGNIIQATARFVDVETGEILYTLRARKPHTQVFDLQDQVAVEARKSVKTLRMKLRPGK